MPLHGVKLDPAIVRGLFARLGFVSLQIHGAPLGIPRASLSIDDLVEHKTYGCSEHAIHKHSSRHSRVLPA